MKHLLLLLIVTACSSSKIATSPVMLPTVTAPRAAPMNLATIKWNVMTGNLSSNRTLYTLDQDNYVKLDTNLLDIKRYIEEQAQTILFYEQLENSKLDVIKSGYK